MVDWAVDIADTTVPGLGYVRNYLTHAEQAQILDEIDREPWSAELRRRVQHYGYRYDYKRKSVDRDQFLGPLPGWASSLAERLRQDRRTPHELDQLIVNEYLPGQGIAQHIDCVPCFADTVLSLSLGSHCVLTMTLPETGEQVPVLLEPGSLLVLAGEARYRWTHGIPARKKDLVAGAAMARGRRVSLTYRTVLLPQNT